MFGLGWPEVGIIALAAILIFGPKKIPELGNTLGKTLRGFKEEVNSDKPNGLRRDRDDDQNLEQDKEGS